jgi:hypothetical protein
MRLEVVEIRRKCRMEKQRKIKRSDELQLVG